MSLRDRKSTPPKRSRVKVLAETTGDVDLATLQKPPPPRVYTREEPGPLDIPQTIQMSFTPGRSWDPASILKCKADADGGNFQNAADLIESMLADTVIAGSLQLRVNALQGLPMRFVGGNESVIEALSLDFWAMETAGEAAFRRTWGLMLNIVPNYTKRLDELDNRIVPRFEPWNPRWLSWQWSDRGIEYYMNTAGGRVKLADQPGRWGLYCPQGFAGGRPWVHGLWYALATWWLAKSYAIADLAAFGQSHATPKWFLKQLEGTLMPGPEGEAAKRSAIRFLSKIPERSGMYVPYGFDVKQEETTSQAWQAITDLIKIADIAMTKLILGSDAGTTANATYASSYTGEGVRTDLAVADDDADSSYMHDGPLRLWYGLNFRGTKRAQLQQGNVIQMLQDPVTRQYRMMSDRERRMPQRAFVRELSDRVRSGDEVPWPTRDITPPEDLAKIAQTQVSAADALVKLASAASSDASGAIGKALVQMDMPRYLARYFPMTGDDESGVQLEDQRTGFPTVGDDEPVSLRRSQWPVFDLAYARALKEDHPEIWDAGGSTGEEHSGDSQYAILAPLWARGGAARTDKEIDAVKTREAWAARHRGNKRLAGVVALIKWLVVGDIGEKAMKDVIDEEKEKRQMNLETGPKNVRQHLHEGLQVADEIVEQLQQATPDAMGDATGEVKRILAKAADYAEARTMLEQSFPNLDRTKIRNMLTGGMLIAQATGMQTVQQEVDGGRGSK